MRLSRDLKFMLHQSRYSSSCNVPADSSNQRKKERSDELHGGSCTVVAKVTSDVEGLEREISTQGYRGEGLKGGGA